MTLSFLEVMGYFIFLVCYTIVVGCLCNIEGRKLKDKKKAAVVLLLVPYFIVYVLADGNSMTDTPSYIEFFEQAKGVSFQGLKDVNAYFEYGWLLLTYLLSRISHSPQIIFFFIGSLIIYCYGKSIEKYSPIPGLSIIIFLCTIYPQSLYVLRQHSAIAIILLSLPAILNRDIVAYLACMICAISLHLSAIVFLPMYWLYSVKLNKKFFVAVLIVIPIFSFLALGFLNKIIDQFAFLGHYGSYLEEGEVGNYTAFLIHLVELFLCLYLLHPVSEVETATKLFFLMLIVALLLDVVGTRAPITGRLNMYYSVSDIFILPIACSRIRNPNLRIVCICAICLCFVIKSIISESWTGNSLGSFRLII